MRQPAKLLDTIGFPLDECPVPVPPVEDFTDYMWMVDELEDFDRQVEEELWEEYFIEACFEEMLQEEEAHLQHLIITSKLNPDAPEFVPKSRMIV